MSNSSKQRFSVEHEFDFEPTYVVDTSLGDDADPIVSFHPRLHWQLRQRLAQAVADELNNTDPAYVEVE